MSADLYFQNVEVENFRAFRKLNIEKFSRINVIGGFNAVGKSTLLEVLFLTVDRRNFLSMIRPYAWRRMPTEGRFSLRSFFPMQDSDFAHIEHQSRLGKIRIDFAYAEIPAKTVVEINSAAITRSTGETPFVQENELGTKGVIMKSTVNDEKDGSILFVESSTGILTKINENGIHPIPNAKYLSVSTGVLQTDDVQSLSDATMARFLPDIVADLKAVLPRIQGLQILMLGGQPAIHAVMDDGQIFPMALLGDGAKGMLALMLSVYNNKHGVIFIDELDSAYHYSVVAKIWGKISELAKKLNVQIFIVSHSRETITSIAKGVADAGNSNEFLYMRLEKKDGDHNCVYYTAQDVIDSGHFEIEIR
ncbi:AAA family ATPase [Inquilinus limosus]|uniref:AAA family ATPase n=1 Tax=Inquilinus limosus TaxID=171674 RepID=UPI00138B1047|nr:ATP-binding protein [Inquilinus limosus]